MAQKCSRVASRFDKAQMKSNNPFYETSPVTFNQCFLENLKEWSYQSSCNWFDCCMLSNENPANFPDDREWGGGRNVSSGFFMRSDGDLVNSLIIGKCHFCVAIAGSFQPFHEGMRLFGFWAQLSLSVISIVDFLTFLSLSLGEDWSLNQKALIAKHTFFMWHITLVPPVNFYRNLHTNGSEAD